MTPTTRIAIASSQYTYKILKDMDYDHVVHEDHLQKLRGIRCKADKLEIHLYDGIEEPLELASNLSALFLSVFVVSCVVTKIK